MTSQGRLAVDSVEIQVADNGVAIPEENLGLAIVRAIVDKNKGSLEVTSQAGLGTACVVRLPAAGPAS